MKNIIIFIYILSCFSCVSRSYKPQGRYVFSEFEYYREYVFFPNDSFSYYVRRGIGTTDSFFGNFVLKKDQIKFNVGESFLLGFDYKLVDTGGKPFLRLEDSALDTNMYNLVSSIKSFTGNQIHNDSFIRGVLIFERTVPDSIFIQFLGEPQPIKIYPKNLNFKQGGLIIYDNPRKKIERMDLELKIISKKILKSKDGCELKQNSSSY